MICFPFDSSIPRWDGLKHKRDIDVLCPVILKDKRVLEYATYFFLFKGQNVKDIYV